MQQYVEYLVIKTAGKNDLLIWEKELGQDNLLKL